MVRNCSLLLHVRLTSRATDVYQDTFEKLSHIVKRFEEVTARQSQSAMGPPASSAKPSGVSYMVRWAKDDPTEHGPCAAADMESWKSAGLFKQVAVVSDRKLVQAISRPVQRFAGG